MRDLPEPQGLLALRRAYLAGKPTQAPSALGMPSKFMQEQARDKRTIYCNRPPNAFDPIPVMLLHPVFGQFIDDTENLEPTAEDNRLVRELAVVMSSFHDTETRRGDHIREKLNQSNIRLVQTVIEGSQYRTDGDMQHGDYRYVIAEMKNEIGARGAEPYAQASLYYLESTREQAVAHPGSILPTLLVLFFGGCVCYDTLRRDHLWDHHAGPYMAFAGAAWNLRPNVQVLSTAVPFHYHTTDEASQRRAARHIAAFRHAAESLKLYYEQGLPAARESDKTQRQMYPHPTTYRDLGDSTQHHFQYVSSMPGGNLVFDCQRRDGLRVCVKFTRRYSREVHEFCASRDFAPKLLGYEGIPGGWHMVVMEHLGEDYMQFKQSSVNLASRDELERNITILQQAHLVHGDIRFTNTMVPSNGQGPIKLVDFDWAGRHGTVRYPANVRSGADLWRPAGATDNRLITVAHDIAMLYEMFGLTTRGLTVV